MENKKFMTGMLNDEGKCVDLYIPRKCDYTNKILNSKDKSSVQMNVAEVQSEYNTLYCYQQVDEQGKYTRRYTTVVLSGFLRAKGQSSYALEQVLHQRGFVPIQQTQ